MTPAAPGIEGLRARAETLQSPLPPLLARAERLAATVAMGEHGRRRAGPGEAFWQFRAAQPGDGRRAIDWRQSARGDDHFVRQTEWQIAQGVTLWVDPGASMRFGAPEAKADRARLLALALAVGLLRAGERVGLPGRAPRSGRAQVGRIARGLATEAEVDHAPPALHGSGAVTQAVWLSDFLGDPGPLEGALSQARARGVRGTMLQVLAPEEETFPFRGRTVFESVAGTARHETMRADALRDRYLDRLAERRAHLGRLCREAGWRFGLHCTDTSAASALIWLHGAVGGQA
ncbi:MAG: DUF58 domain-containing protein [Paracoccaceae bacterium]